MNYKKFSLLGLLGLSACTNIECPLDNVVIMTCSLYSSETETSLTMADALTVHPANHNFFLLNQATDISSFVAPLRNTGGTDTLLLSFSNTQNQLATDTLFVTHTPTPHFESIDCPASVFHHITTVRWTSHSLGLMPLTIDSVAIIRSLVDYEDMENLRLYLRATTSE